MSQKTISINNVNQTTGAATITIQVAEGTNHLNGSGSVGVNAEFSPFIPGANAPAYTASNLPSLNMTGTGSDTTVPTRKYYFGQGGNAFYAVTNGASSAYWELVDTDFKMLAIGEQSETGIYTLWSDPYEGNYTNKIIDNVNSMVSTYFNNADQNAMKNASISDDNSCKYKDYKNYSYYKKRTKPSARLWPLSLQQLSSVTLPSESYPIETINGLAKVTVQAANSLRTSAWVRSYAGADSSTKNYAWATWSSAYFSAIYHAENNLSYAAFNLDLSKVLCHKAALSGTTSTPMTYIGTKIDADMKFLIMAGSHKAYGFTINSNGKYSGASTSLINNGTNYVSEIIYDSTGKSLYYGNLGTITSKRGTVELVIPDGIASGTYTVAVFEEEKCAAYKTDYASYPVYFTLTV